MLGSPTLGYPSQQASIPFLSCQCDPRSCTLSCCQGPRTLQGSPICSCQNCLGIVLGWDLRACFKSAHGPSGLQTSVSIDHQRPERYRRLRRQGKHICHTAHRTPHTAYHNVLQPSPGLFGLQEFNPFAPRLKLLDI